MADFYSELADFARDILSPTSAGGLGQGDIQLVRYTPGPPPTNPWDPPSDPVKTRAPLKGAARGVSEQLVGTEVAPGVQLLATDLIVIVAPWGGQYMASDELEIDGAPVTVMRVDRIPAAGIVSAFRFYVRGGAKGEPEPEPPDPPDDD